MNLHSRHNGHGTRSHGFWGFLNFHEAHAAVTGNGEAVVVAETGHLYTYFITGLCEVGGIGGVLGVMYAMESGS